MPPRFRYFALIIIELGILSALILATRCANYRDVFVDGNIYFTDADCYARMTRVRMCAEHPGLIIRHHNFENFPHGTTPHTTAPLDYAIVSLSILLVATFLLTIWQARWSYFFMSIFVIALPSLLAPLKSRAAVWVAFVLSIFPILQFWGARIWPNESETAAQIERRNESKQLRELAIAIRSERTRAFLAPWWLSPAISYWSNQPGVAGSSHEALDGIVESARFFLATEFLSAREILRNRLVEWVLAYDWERVAQNSRGLLGTTVSDRAIGRILDRTPGQAPRFLVLSGQNQTAKLFRFADKL